MFKYLHTIAFHISIPSPPFNSVSQESRMQNALEKKEAAFHLLQCIPRGKL